MIAEKHRLPRVMLAAPSSGSGKTMVTTGVLAALTARGLTVSPHKVGPDYIDPGYHAAACGRPGRNLDAHLVSPERIVPLLLHGAATPVPADIAIIEGVMGLFDGALGREGFGSSAHVAALTSTPVVLVVDCSATSRSVGATVHGFATFDREVAVSGVILNKVASAGHEAEVRQAVRSAGRDRGIEVIGAIPRIPDVVVPSRHLGLVPAAERVSEASRAVAGLAETAEKYLDLDLMVSLANGAPPLSGEPWSPAGALAQSGASHPPPLGPRPRIAVVSGAAFTFGYAETTELLEAAGAEVVCVDPLLDEALPPHTDGLLIPGGFPEVYAENLASNSSMRESIREFARDGGPVVAECAGLLYLGESLDGAPMCGVLPTRGAMSERLTLGYPRATALADSVLAARGEVVTGHVFHRTRVEPIDGAADLQPAWRLDEWRGGVQDDGYVSASGNVHGSYLHTHWAGAPQMAARFVAAARGTAL